VSREGSVGGVFEELEELEALVSRLRSEVRAVHSALGQVDPDPAFGLTMGSSGSFAGSRQVERAKRSVEDMASVVRDLASVVAHDGVEGRESLPGFEAHEVTLSGGEGPSQDCPSSASARS